MVLLLPFPKFSLLHILYKNFMRVCAGWVPCRVPLETLKQQRTDKNRNCHSISKLLMK